MRVDTGAIKQFQCNSRSTRSKFGVFGDEIVGLSAAPDKEVDSRLLYETARVSVQLEASDAAV